MILSGQVRLRHLVLIYTTRYGIPRIDIAACNNCKDGDIIPMSGNVVDSHAASSDTVSFWPPRPGISVSQSEFNAGFRITVTNKDFIVSSSRHSLP